MLGLLEGLGGRGGQWMLDCSTVERPGAWTSFCDDDRRQLPQLVENDNDSSKSKECTNAPAFPGTRCPARGGGRGLLGRQTQAHAAVGG